MLKVRKSMNIKERKRNHTVVICKQKWIIG